MMKFIQNLAKQTCNGHKKVIISHGKSHVKSLAALWPMQVDSVVPPPLTLDICQCHVSHHITSSAGSAKRPQTEQECRTISLQFREHLEQILPPPSKKKKPETGCGGGSRRVFQ